MDFTNCTDPGFFTDVLFEPQPGLLGTCNSSAYVAYILTGLVIGLRGLTVLVKWYGYYERRRTRPDLKSSPVNSVLHTSIFATLTLFCGLFYINAVNAFNGLSYALFSVVYTLFLVMAGVTLTRMIRLGTRMGGRNKQISKLLEAADANLETLDGTGKFLTCVSILCGFVFVITFLIAAPVLASLNMTSTLILTASIGLYAKAVLQLTMSLVVAWQIQRVYTKIFQKMPKKNILKRYVLWKLRYLQFLYMIGASVPFLLYILVAARIIPWFWWSVAMFAAATEAIIAFASVIGFCFRRKHYNYTLWKSSSQPRIPQQEQKQQEEPKSGQGEASVGEDDEHRDDGFSPLKAIGLGFKKPGFVKKYQNQKFKPNFSRVTEASQEGITSMASYLKNPYADKSENQTEVASTTHHPHTNS